MALSPTCKAKGDALETQKTEDEENGCLEWFWGCIGWTKPWRATLERRPNPSERLSFGYAGTSQSIGLSTKASVADSSASSDVYCPRSTYHCWYEGCEEIRTFPDLIDWHYEKDHNGGGGYTATRQDERSGNPANPKQDTATATASCLHVMEKPSVLSILSCKADGHVDAFVQLEDQGMTKQWPQLYSLAEFYKLNNAPVALEEFLKKFSS
ncbi:hypothetical protein Alg215_09878 [Pyrenophora tritici-repentis]|nr:hypothetical protein Alg215_09878 [Pyrenophora tritici-repentis]